MHYVIGDLHGSFKELKLLTSKIEKIDENAEFILIGDIIDRGYDSLELLEWAIENVNKENSKYKMIIGNHEHDKLEYLERYFKRKEKDNKFTFDKYHYDNYNFKDLIDEKRKTEEDLKKYMDFFKSLPVFIDIDINMENRTQRYLIIHGGIPSFYGPSSPTSVLTEDEHINNDFFEISDTNKTGSIKRRVGNLVWERNNNNVCRELKKSILIHGHTPTTIDDFEDYGGCKGQIYYTQNEINIDCGAVFEDTKEHNLAAICLENLEEYYAYDIDKEAENYEIQQMIRKNMRDMSRKEFNDWYDENNIDLPYPPYF